MFNWFKRKWSEFVALFVQEAPEETPVVVEVLDPEPEVKPVPKGCQKCPTALDCATIKTYDRIEPPVTVARRRPDTTVSSTRQTSYRSDRDSSRRDYDSLNDVTSPVSPFYMLQADPTPVTHVHVYDTPSSSRHSSCDDTPSRSHSSYDSSPSHSSYDSSPSYSSYSSSSSDSYSSSSSDSYSSSSCDSSSSCGCD